VLEAYPETVKLVYKNYPLRSHRFAEKAAGAALAAHEKGKFWEYHDKLFANYNKLSDEKLREISRELGLNEKEIEQRMVHPKIKAQIERDVRDARQAGVAGTPTIFVNGRWLKKRSMDGFKAAIAKELARGGQAQN
jgi:protein-disulfide isomerase